MAFLEWKILSGALIEWAHVSCELLLLFGKVIKWVHIFEHIKLVWHHLHFSIRALDLNRLLIQTDSMRFYLIYICRMVINARSHLIEWFVNWVVASRRLRAACMQLICLRFFNLRICFAVGNFLRLEVCLRKLWLR